MNKGIKINKGMMRMTQLQQVARLRAIVRTMGVSPYREFLFLYIVTLEPRGKLWALVRVR